MWLDALLLAFQYLLSIIPATVAGIVLMELLIELGWIQRLGFVTAPFMRFGHLREEVGVSFLVSFGSPTAGNSMVAQLNKKGLIDNKETLIASLVTSFPATFIFVRDLTPVLVILLGTTGLIYLGIVVGVGLLRTAISLAFGRFLLPPKKIAIIEQSIKTKKFSAALQSAILSSWAPLQGIIPTMIIAAIIVFQLIDIGFFDMLSAYLKDLPVLKSLPSPALPVIAAWFASNIGAYTIASKLLDISRYVGTMNEDEKREVRYGSFQVILTNPEMIHMSFLPWHHIWKRFLSNLKFIVVDESHYYRGVKGSNMANLIRRLNRICTYYGAHPRYICCSATIGNPGEHTGALIGRDVTVINKDGSGRGPQKFMFWNPPFYVNEAGFNVRRSTFGESLSLFNRFVQYGLQTIAFTRARQAAERMYVASRSGLREKGLADKISPYRAGYFGKEREEIEKKLSDGSIRGVISTNALELGIDIGGLDACIIDGYPGTIMNTKQQAGRAGRGNGESIVALVASSNALDQYYMRYPKEFFERNCEEAVLNVSNPYIQAGHVLCAAKEIPFTGKDEKYFGSGLVRIIELLENEGLLTGGDSKSAVDPNPHGQVSIRGIDRDAYSIFAFNGGRRIPIEKDIEKALAFKEAFEGAIYLHMGTPYHVSKLDHEKKEIHVEETKAEYYTKALVNSEIFIKERYTEKPLPSCKDAKVGLGTVEVVEQVTGYKKFRYFSETIIGEASLEMPKLSLETVALWVELPDRFSELVETHSRDFAGGIHAIEHAMIAMYPLRLLADRNDVGGVSTPGHNDLNGKCGIFVYDGHRGGVGYAEKGYEIISDILEVTLRAIEGCPCSDGCPSCIQSPKCGNHNNPLDKHAALIILHGLLGKPPYVPKKAKPQKSPVPPPKNSDKTPGIGAALDRVRSQLRREAIKPKESKEKLSKNTKTKSFETPNSTKYQPQERSPSKNEEISWDDRLKEIRKIHPRAYESWGEQEEIRLKKTLQ